MITRTFICSVFVSAALATAVCAADLVPKNEANSPTKVATNTTPDQSVLGNDAFEKMITSVTSNVITPIYKEAAEQATELSTATLAFCSQPNAKTLQAIRKHWSLALTAWQTSEMALFGPALDKQRDLHIYFRPVKKRVIKQLWASPKPITLDAVNFAGVGAKGFATLEYLLVDRSLTDTETLERFNTAATTRHCEHLLAVSILLKDDINAIHNAWVTSYPTTLASSEQAMSLILGTLDQSAEAVATKLRNALAKDAHLAGKDDKREKRNAHKLEAWRSGHTLQNIRANISGIKKVLNNGGFITWLDDNKHHELANTITEQLAAIDAISFADSDLFQQIEKGDLESADLLFKESMQLSRLIKDMADAMGVQLGFNDNDGD